MNPLSKTAQTGRSAKAKLISQKLKNFFKANPQIEKTLKIFDISYSQYQKSFESNNFYTTDTTTSFNISALKGRKK